MTHLGMMEVSDMSSGNIYSYPHFGYSEQLEDVSALFGHNIYWTLKEDGSNCGIYYDYSTDQYRVRSRNCDIANFESKVKSLRAYNYCCKIIDYFKESLGNDVMIFCELLVRGRSPTGIKVYDEDDLVLFDIFNITTHRYYTYNALVGILNQLEFGYFKNGIFIKDTLKLVPLVSISTVYNEQELNESIARVLEIIKNFKDSRGVKCNNEGVVGKIYERIPCSHGCGYFFMKEKNYIERPPKLIKENVPTKSLPIMSDEDFRACFFKAKAELTESQWKDKSIAMPRIALEIKKECSQLGVRINKDIFKSYCEILKED